MHSSHLNMPTPAFFKHLVDIIQTIAETLFSPNMDDITKETIVLPADLKCFLAPISGLCIKLDD